MPAITDIADAVVAELNDATSPLAGLASAARGYRPAFDLEDMKDLHVTVVPRGIETAGASRGQSQADVQIDIGVQKKLASADAAEIDPLMALVQQLVFFLRARKLAAASSSLWVRTENTPIFAAEHLEQFRQFTSVLTLTYRVMQ